MTVLICWGRRPAARRNDKYRARMAAFSWCGFAGNALARRTAAVETVRIKGTVSVYTTSSIVVMSTTPAFLTP
jgi:hypothetical protein